MSLISDTHGRLIVGDFYLPGLSLRLICVYASTRLIIYTGFRGLLSYLECDKVFVLSGDFNCVCEQVDRSRVSNSQDKTVRPLEDMLENNY